MHGGARIGAGRKKGIGLTYDIQKHCQKFINELLQDEAIKIAATEQLSDIIVKEEKVKHYLYLIESNDLIKIGYTTNFKKRIINYRTHNKKINVLLVHEAENAFEIESELHKEFEHANVGGEWFDLTLHDIYHILVYLNNGW